MKWTKLQYGEWPEGEIVLRINSWQSKIDFAHGYIKRSVIDNEVYFYHSDAPHIKLTIDSIYDLELYYIVLKEIEML